MVQPALNTHLPQLHKAAGLRCQYDEQMYSGEMGEKE